VRAVQMGPCATATPPNRTGGAIAPKLRARLYPVVSPRRISFGGVLSSSLRAHIEVFGSAAATKCSRPRRWPLLRKTLWLGRPQSTAAKLRARLNPKEYPRISPVTGVLSPSLRAYIEVFGSAAATKRKISSNS